MVPALTPLRLAAASWVLGVTGFVQAGACSPAALWTTVAMGAGLGLAMLVPDDAGAAWADLLAAVLLVASNRLLLGVWTAPGGKPQPVSLRELAAALAERGLLLLAWLRGGRPLRLPSLGLPRPAASPSTPPCGCATLFPARTRTSRCTAGAGLPARGEPGGDPDGERPP